MLGNDLNGDRDTSDVVIVVHDISTGATVSTGMTVGRTFNHRIISFDDNLVLSSAGEVYDVSTGRVTQTTTSFGSIDAK